MTTVAEGGHPRFLRQAESTEVAKTVTVEVELSGDFSALTHVFLGVQMFDVGGDLIVDSAGSFAVTLQTINTKYYEAPPTATIDATAPATVSWAANTFKIKVVPSSLSDTVTWKIVATANRN